MTEPRRAPAAWIWLLSLLASCGQPVTPMTDLRGGAPLPVAPYGAQTRVADLAAEDMDLCGVSGLAASRAYRDTIWAISDTATQLFAIQVAADGVEVVKTRVRGADRFDWEDLAWFEEDGEPFLMIADVGTNRKASTARRRGDVEVGMLHIVREPRPGDKKVKILRTLTFELPCRPDRDIESVAVDSSRREVLVVEKRAAVKRLLVLDLDREVHTPTAQDWTEVALPDLHTLEQQPERAPSTLHYQTNWRRNPTALDVRDDQAILLTSRHAYVYERGDGQSWSESFARTPAQLQLPFTLKLPDRSAQTLPANATLVLPQREALCVTPDGASVFIASEQHGSPEAWLVRLDRR